VAAARDLPAGHLLAADDLALMRPATGIPPRHIEEVVGRRLSTEIAAGTPIAWADLD
jgi:N,N'-diacetyllegionaminate synthase